MVTKIKTKDRRCKDCNEYNTEIVITSFEKRKTLVMGQCNSCGRSGVLKE